MITPLKFADTQLQGYEEISEEPEHYGDTISVRLFVQGGTVKPIKITRPVEGIFRITITGRKANPEFPNIGKYHEIHGVEYSHSFEIPTTYNIQTITATLDRGVFTMVIRKNLRVGGETSINWDKQ